jgi:hypothetical protein
MVFNNLYNKFLDLFTLTKLRVNRDNTKFNVFQVVDILLQNWFLVDPTFIIQDSKEEDEGATKSPLETWTTWTTRVSRVHFWCAPIALDKEMDNVEEFNGTNNQLKTSQRLK